MSLKEQMFGDVLDLMVEDALESDTDAEAVVAALIVRAAAITAARIGMTDAQASEMSEAAVKAMAQVAWRKVGS